MTTQTRIRIAATRAKRPIDSGREFRKLLRDSREIMELHLVGQFPDLDDPTVQLHLSPEETLVYEQMKEGAADLRAKLFMFGQAFGLSKREIIVALLRPIASLVRPSTTQKGCGCFRCQARRALVTALR